METERKDILVEKRGAVAKITINRPEKRNALSRAAIREMLGAFEELRNDNSITVVLTTGPVMWRTARAVICPSSQPRAVRTEERIGAPSHALITWRK